MKITTPICRRLNGTLICSAPHPAWDALRECLNHSWNVSAAFDASDTIHRCTNGRYDPAHPQTIGLECKHAAAIAACGWPVEP